MAFDAETSDAILCRERLLRLRALFAEMLADAPTNKAFDMAVWHYGGVADANLETDYAGCGAVGCIGGWTQLLFRAELAGRTSLQEDKNDWQDEPIRVGALLGLNRTETDELFHMETSGGSASYREVSLSDAIAHLDYILSGNRPDWRAILPHLPRT